MTMRRELLSIGLIATCVCMSMLKTAVWGQTQDRLTPATYFVFRMEQLKGQLNITSDQELQVKHIVEQEMGELTQYACNIAMSRKNQQVQFRSILTNSENRMRPILTGEQSWKLHKLDHEMLEEFKSVKTPHGCTLAYWGHKTGYK
jgi:Spy/CpxP family protein refolding chaperone